MMDVITVLWFTGRFLIKPREIKSEKGPSRKITFYSLERQSIHSMKRSTYHGMTN